MGRLVYHADVSDPMSGFFLVDRAFFRQVVHRLSGTGFKILLDLLASSRRPIRVGEVPYHFRSRQLGESKLDVRVELEYLYLILDKVIGRFVPIRFVLFVLVGSAGLLIHLSTLGLLYDWGKTSFRVAQLAGTIIAMTFNFLLNNAVTFRDRRLRGMAITCRALYVLCGLLIGCSDQSQLRAVPFSSGRDVVPGGACGNRREFGLELRRQSGSYLAS